MPWITPGRPDLCSGESGSPDPGAHDASARAFRRTTAAFSAIGVLRRPDLRGASSTPSRLPGGRPGTWLHRPRTQVPRPAPPRTTPRPKRPSVDGTALTYSEYHPKCQQVAAISVRQNATATLRNAASRHKDVNWNAEARRAQGTFSAFGKPRRAPNRAGRVRGK